MFVVIGLGLGAYTLYHLLSGTPDYDYINRIGGNGIDHRLSNNEVLIGYSSIGAFILLVGLYIILMTVTWRLTLDDNGIRVKMLGRTIFAARWDECHRPSTRRTRSRRNLPPQNRPQNPQAPQRNRKPRRPPEAEIRARAPYLS